MCEDMAHRRANLNSILELCESHHKASLLPPPNKVIKQLVEDVFQDSVSLKKHLYLKKLLSRSIYKIGSQRVHKIFISRWIELL